MRYHARINHYAYRAEWWPEHGEYVGRCIESQAAVAVGADLQEAIVAVERAVDACIAESEAIQRKVVVRTSPALHAQLVIEAVEQSVSMNQ
jgi:predicted HicB family RNase H-like nuclease